MGHAGNATSRCAAMAQPLMCRQLSILKNRILAHFHDHTAHNHGTEGIEKKNESAQVCEVSTDR